MTIKSYSILYQQADIIALYVDPTKSSLPSFLVVTILSKINHKILSFGCCIMNSLWWGRTRSSMLTYLSTVVDILSFYLLKIGYWRRGSVSFHALSTILACSLKLYIQLTMKALKVLLIPAFIPPLSTGCKVISFRASKWRGGGGKSTVFAQCRNPFSAQRPNIKIREPKLAKWNGNLLKVHFN